MLTISANNAKLLRDTNTLEDRIKEEILIRRTTGLHTKK